MDNTTLYTQKWIEFMSKNKVLRINGLHDKKINWKNIDINSNTFIVEYESQEIDLINDINSIWYRRSDKEYSAAVLRDNELNQTSLNDNIQYQYREIRSFLYYALKEKYWLGSPYLNRLNKPIQLQIANEVGLNVPATIITSSRIELLNFQKQNGTIAFKPINNIMDLSFDNRSLSPYTRTLERKDILSFSEEFFPSYFQKYIDKLIEIRVFFLEGSFYSMGIDSQSSIQTESDFRNYTGKNPNRYFPLSIPKRIEKKLQSIFERLNLNKGSVDLILSRKKKYFFLEINPVGQFGMVSFPCNYKLERKIAQLLIKNDKKK